MFKVLYLLLPITEFLLFLLKFSLLVAVLDNTGSKHEADQARINASSLTSQKTGHMIDKL